MPSPLVLRVSELSCPFPSTSLVPVSGSFSDTGIPAPELIRWKTSDTSGEGLLICRTWLNRGSRGVRPGRRFRLESISSRCLTPASWMTRELGAPGPLQDKLIGFLGWGEGKVRPRLQSLWRKISLGSWGQLGENRALIEEPALPPQLQAGPDG